MKRLLRRFLDFLYKPLFGEDIFISYARDDGSKYARELFVRLTKGEKRFSCYMDELGTEPGKQVPPTLLRKVRNCSMLVLVGSPCASTSEGVRDEIAEFLSVTRNRERIIPIDINNQSFRKSLWSEMVTGIDLETEPNADALEGNVADSVIERIERASGYRKQYDRLRLARNWTFTVLSFLLLLSAGAAAFAYQRIVMAQEAETRARLSSESANAAEARASEAETKANLAVATATAAENAAAAADIKRGEAEEKTKAAESKREQAEKVSRQQEAIAEARRLANRSAELIDSNVEESLDYAMQSVRKVESNGIRLFEATQALRESLRILPRQHEFLFRNNWVRSVLSPDAKYVATLEDVPGNIIRIFEGKYLPPIVDLKSPPKPIHSYAFETQRLGAVSQFAISDGFLRAAVVQESSNHEFNFVVKDTQNKVLLDSSTIPSNPTGSTIKSIALSPNGKFLALVVTDAKKGELGSGKRLPKTTESIVLVDVDAQKIGQIYSVQDIDLSNLSFGKIGNCLVAVGHPNVGDVFFEISYVMVWTFPQSGSEKVIDHLEHVDPVYHRLEEVKNAAISDDGKLLAVTNPVAGYVTIWEVDPLRLVARLPEPAGAEQLRFSSDSQTLVTLGLGGFSSWDTRGYTAQSQSVAWNEDLAMRFEPPGQKFFAYAKDGVISSVTESRTQRHFPLAPHLLLAPPLNKDADKDQKGLYHFNRTLDPFVFALSSDGRILAALVDKGNGDFAIQLYKRNGDRYTPHTLIPSGTAYLSHVFQEPEGSENPYAQIEVSPNGKYVAAHCDPGSTPSVPGSEHALCIWDVDRGRWLSKRVENLFGLVRFKFSPNEKYVACFGSSQPLVVFNIENQSDQRFDRTNLYNFDYVNFDRDEKLIAGANYDGDVVVLTIRDLSRVTHLPSRTGFNERNRSRLNERSGISEFAFSRDGKQLLMRSSDLRFANSERWEVWELDNYSLIREACSIIKSYKFYRRSRIHNCK